MNHPILKMIAFVLVSVAVLNIADHLSSPGRPPTSAAAPSASQPQQTEFYSEERSSVIRALLRPGDQSGPKGCIHMYAVARVDRAYPNTPEIQADLDQCGDELVGQGMTRETADKLIAHEYASDLALVGVRP